MLQSAAVQPLATLGVVSLAALLAWPAAASPHEASADDPYAPARLTWSGPRPPWPRRRRSEEKVKPSAHGLRDLQRWPAEPASPKTVDEAQLASALKQLCGGWMPPRRPLQFARAILSSSREHGVDPFLVGAFIYRQSRCLPQEKSEYGSGLAKLDPRMHASFLRRGVYRYWVLREGEWKRRELTLDRYSLGNLRRPEASIYFAAGLLAMAQRQCPGIDAPFGSVPHRHPISHLIWGDRVRGAGPEDRVLQARRALLEHYSGKLPEAQGSYEELALRLPLDGAPRVVSSVMGSDRADGKRVHKGIDFASTYAEPVRAVADGRVVLAGLDRPTGGPINVDPEEAKTIKSSQMGPGGLFVMVLHDKGLRSAYMHLSSYIVAANAKVKSGDVIGYVGKTGAKESGAHLHFELRAGGKHVDPLPHLKQIILPDATWLGQKLAVEEQRVRRKRRVDRWRAIQSEREAKTAATTAPGRKKRPATRARQKKK
jgi:murein DD-endopeptidase MepM/ murein hydrolase activator NlpD